MDLFNYLLFPLLLTLGIEGICLLILKERRYQVYLLALGMNIFTNISLNLFGYFQTISKSWVLFLCILLLEGIIWFLEGVGYYLYLKKIRKALCYTLVCNLSSFLLGIIFQDLLLLLWR